MKKFWWIAAVALLAASCGASGSAKDADGSSPTTQSDEQMLQSVVKVERSICETIIGDTVSATLTGYAQSSWQGESAMRQSQVRLGEANYWAYIEIFNEVFTTLQVLGLEKSLANANWLVQEKCLALHPFATTTTSFTPSSTPKTLPPPPQPGDSAGTAIAPSSVWADCVGLVTAAHAVECTVGAWRSNTLSQSKSTFLDRTTEAVLVNTPPPSAITPTGCKVISSSRTHSEYEYSDNTVIECGYILDENRILTFTVKTGGVGTNPVITTIVIAS
jgi:hypothetical protein